jgi:hypothetical protein
MIRSTNEFFRWRKVAQALSIVAVLASFGVAVTAVAQPSLGMVPGVPSMPSSSGVGIGLGSGQSAPAPVPEQFAPSPNTGPVTGYGPGGMARPPGTPIRPPYR